MTIMEKFVAAKAEMNRLREEAREIVANVFEEASKELFKQHPTLEKFAWTQYTPYFNDGDECTFSVHRDYYINGINEYGDTMDEDEDEESERLFTYDAKYAKIWTEKGLKWKALRDAVTAFMDIFDDDDLRDMFDDHVEVVVTKDGAEVFEYSHD